MPITTFRGEKSLAELADSLYAKLKPEHRADAERALLEANPQLKNLTGIAVGTVLRVPELAGVAPNRARVSDDPVRLAEDSLVKSLAAYRKLLEPRFDAEASSLKDEAALFKKEVPALLNLDLGIDKLAETIKASLTERAKTLKLNQQRVPEALDQLLEDLGKLSSANQSWL
jgi:hypothetical protein